MNCPYCKYETKLSSDNPIMGIHICTNCPILKVKFFIHKQGIAPFMTVYVVKNNDDIYYLNLKENSTILKALSDYHDMIKLNHRLDITPIEAPSAIKRLLSLNSFS